MKEPRDIIADFLVSQGAGEAGVYDLADRIEQLLNQHGWELIPSYIEAMKTNKVWLDSEEGQASMGRVQRRLGLVEEKCALCGNIHFSDEDCPVRLGVDDHA